MKISDLKQKEVRKVIAVMLDDNKVEQVTIYNPLGEKRKEILAMMSDYSNKTTVKDTQELTKEIIRQLTDLKVYKKDNIEDIINNPKGELLIILREINEIKTELEYEFLTQKMMEINQATINLLTARTLEKAKHLHELSLELETDGNTDDLEKILNDIVSDEGSKNGKEV